MNQFVHLHVHTEYSVVDSLLHIAPLTSQVADYSQPALALTDQSNMFALVKFYSAARKAGIKPIMGADLWVELSSEDSTSSSELFRITVLCQNHQGYLNLSRLISKSYQLNQKIWQLQQVAVVDQAWLAELNEGLIVLAGRESDIGQAALAGKLNLIATQSAWWQEHFADRFYLELVRTGRENEEKFVQGALEIAERYQLPVVATNDVRFLARDDFEAHEVRCCVNAGYVLDDPNRPKRYSEEQYLRSTDEMVELFDDIPEAIENSVLIAKRCNLELKLGEHFLPDFPIPSGMTIAQYFEQVCREGLDQRLAFLFGDQSQELQAEKRQIYEARLMFELKTIVQMGFPGYFLIVADFIQWAKNEKIPVGPGRGSGAGSLVAYALSITDIDPIKYDLLFERFLNPERVSMPDFDVDFCMERRDAVIDYVSDHYGRDHVSQIITFGTMAARAVIRDVGRVLGNPYGVVDGVAKLIPNELGIKLKDALEKEEELQRRYQDDEDVKLLLDLGLKLEGTVRNVGRHAGGVVIGSKPLDEFCPLYSEPGGMGVVTQLDKDDVETIGLVKFDFLGLRTLTIIDWALQAINQGKNPGDSGFVDITTIPLEDQPVFDLIKTGKTTGIFQLESSGMQDLIRRLRPDSFEDIIALVALFRPGPLESGMVDNFIARKHGREAVSYPDAQYQHPSLKVTLEPTYGIILYQEQVMQIAQILSNYSLGEADILRRAMGSKQPEVMAKERSKFEKGALANGIDGGLAVRIFDLVEKFAGYGFNKSHSAAYALVSYQSAWLKTYYPAHFMAAQISSDMDNTEKVVHMINECYAMDLTLITPNINRCEIQFKAVDDKTILYGLGAIKGVGEAALEGIIAEREQNGPYQDLFDLTARRADKRMTRRVLETLIRAGALDCLDNNRQAMLSSVSLALHKAEQQQKDRDSGQEDLFGGLALEDSAVMPTQLVDVPEMLERQRLKGEKDTLGLYLSGHPIEAYRQELTHYVSQDLSKLVPDRSVKRWVAGLVVGMRAKNTRSGGKMGFVTLDDRTARLEAVLRPAVYDAVKELVLPDVVLLMYGTIEEDHFNGGIKLNAEQVVSLADMRAKEARAIKVYSSIEQLTPALIQELSTIIEPLKTDDGLPLVIEYQNNQATAQVKSNWLIRPDDELIETLSVLGWQPEVVMK